MVSLWVMPFSAQGAPEDMAAGPVGGRSTPILPQVGERDSVVREDRMDLVGESFNGVPQESGGVHLPGFLVELNEGELRNAIDGEEHVELAIRVAELAAVDVDIADRGIGKPAALGRRVADRQARDAMAFEAAMQARTRKFWDLIAQAPHDIIEWQQRALAKRDDNSFLDRRQDRAARIARTHRRIGCA